jgi:hypothetical protein
MSNAFPFRSTGSYVATLRTLPAIHFWGLAAAVVAALWVVQFLRLDQSIKHLEAEQRPLESQLQKMSSYAREAATTQSFFNAVINEPEKVRAEDAIRGWTPALRAILKVVPPEIELRDIRAAPERSEGAAEFVIEIDGLSVGATPWGFADQFRLNLEAELGKQFGQPAVAEFERRGSPSEPAQAAPKSTAFRIRVRFLLTAVSTEMGVRPT